MKSNYRKIGDLIQLVDIRNKDLKIKKLLGLSITKQFIPSVANTVGTNMRNYKIIKKNQFACSVMQVRRDKKMPVALLHDFEKAIISQAYPVFEVIDEEEVLPQYLMMWMSRSEFDRHACFLAIGGVRGSLEWEDFCNMELPVPSIEKQYAIVKEYNTIVDRIELNEQLNQKLEETAQALYKHWFVDFEFPDENGLPYKSSGGKMVWNEELERNIPKEWANGNFETLATQFSGYSFKGDKYSFEKGITVVRGENVTEGKLRWDTHKKWNLDIDKRIEKCFLKENDLVIGMDGSKVGKNWSLISKYNLPILLAQRVSCVRAKDPNHQMYLFISMSVMEFVKYVSQVQTGTSVPHISGRQILDFPLVIPQNEYLIKFNSLVEPLIDKRNLNIHQNIKFKNLLSVLLIKMSNINTLSN